MIFCLCWGFMRVPISLHPLQQWHFIFLKFSANVISEHHSLWSHPIALDWGPQLLYSSYTRGHSGQRVKKYFRYSCTTTRQSLGLPVTWIWPSAPAELWGVCLGPWGAGWLPSAEADLMRVLVPASISLPVKGNNSAIVTAVCGTLSAAPTSAPARAQGLR